jgi:cob(I)alamin adenosyltransferase
MKGYVQIYTGDEQGETLAVLGLSLRAAGAGFKVFIARINKAFDGSEVDALERFSDLITLEQYGSGRFRDNRPLPEDVKAVGKAFARVSSILSCGDHPLVIVDKAITAATDGFFSEHDLLELLSAKPDHVELVITGRGAFPSIIERADLVTEIALV